MKQSTLSFAAAKRTASNSYAQVGKPKASSTTVVPKPKTSQPVGKAASKKRETGDDIDDYDDIVIKESSGEEIEDAEAVDSRPSRVDTPDSLKGTDISSAEDKETLPPKTRLQTKKSVSKLGKEKSSNVQTPSQPSRTSNLNLEDLQKQVDATEIDTDALPELDPSSKRWNKLHKAAKVKLGGVPVHGKHDTKAQQILRVFDNSSEYGPCIGMTRLERWQRAESLGLNPPEEVHEILMTKQGQTLQEYKQSVFHGEV